MTAERHDTACKDMTELLVLYHYGELEGPDKAKVEEHTASCGHCRAELDAMRDMLSAITPETPHPFAVARSVNRVKARIRPGRRHGWASKLVPAAITAMIALLAVGIYHNIVLGPSTVGDVAEQILSAPETANTTGMETGKQAVNGDEELLLALLDGPPAAPEEALAPHEEMGPPTPPGHMSGYGEEPSIYELVELEPLEDIDVIDDLEFLEDYDTLAELQPR